MEPSDEADRLNCGFGCRQRNFDLQTLNVFKLNNAEGSEVTYVNFNVGLKVNGGVLE